MASKGTNQGSLLVAAFDFGTTYSGYAFSFRSDPLKVQTNTAWVAGSERLMSLKTSTCLLLNPQGQFDSFGFEAENKYASKAEDEEHHGWRLFRRFKMLLYENKVLNRHSTVEDMDGKSARALPLFAMSIRFLREHLLHAIEMQTVNVEETDIQYVVTVPAIWEDNAKQFMREAAVEAGIHPSRLKLALEPEAASLWCQIVTSEAQVALAGEGTRYMVVDLGGGTADISVHEKKAAGKLKEIHKATGGPWGGIYVDENYMNMLTKIFGRPAMEKLKSDSMGDYFDILRDFETKKRNFQASLEEKLMVRICSALREISDKHDRSSLSDKIRDAGYEDGIELRGRDKLRIESSVVQGWFDGPVSSLISHMKDLFRDPRMRNVSAILLVGGFGESRYVQQRLRDAFQNKTLIVPNEAGLVVMKGAVRFGHDNCIVDTRVMAYSYGIRGHTMYDETRYPESAMVVINGRKKVRNAFVSFIAANKETKVGHEITKGRSPGRNPNYTTFPVIRSKAVDPILSSDLGCEQIGFLTVYHPEGETKDDKKMDVTFIFGETELRVKVRMRKTGKEFYLTIDCLE